MKQNRHILEKVNLVFTWLCFFTAVVSTVYFFVRGTTYLFGKALSATVLVVLFYWFFRRFHLGEFAKTHFVCLVYLFLLCCVGLGLDGYNRIPHFDKLAHLLSGVAFSFLGVLLFIYFLGKHPDIEEEFWLLAALVNGLSALLSVAWEIFEFFGFVLFGVDAQHHLTTGVMDTMGDLIFCVVGTLSATAFLYLWHKRGKLQGILFEFKGFVDNIVGNSR